MNISTQSLTDEIALAGKKTKLISLTRLQDMGYPIDQLPYSIRVILESALRNFDGKSVNKNHIEALINWKPHETRSKEIPFVVSRVILQDYTGVPLLNDLAAMRDFTARQGLDPAMIEPIVPVDLVIDHSVQTQHTGHANAVDLNMKLEFSANKERYQFMKWGHASFEQVRVFPPGTGIIHQVNLELLAQGVILKDGWCYPDTVVGADSHTTMINGLGVVGWGVGGIEAESVMLGQPVYLREPDVIGVNVFGKLSPGISATDIVLTITERLRKENVVGCLVEFFGEGAKAFSVQDRATIANMAPDYGATAGLFHVDEKTLDYYRQTGRDETLIKTIKAYYEKQGLFKLDPKRIQYSRIIDIDLSSIETCIAGPKRPQDRIPLKAIETTLAGLFEKTTRDNNEPKKTGAENCQVQNGDILIASITSCTNTSNPNSVIAAGLLAKKAVEAGLTVNKKIKCAIAPGSRVVGWYLEQSGLIQYLNELGFYIAGYGCATCIGNVGALDPQDEHYIKENNITACSVLSGNRNFEARIHPSIKANFLMSPALVVACAIAGNVGLINKPLGVNKEGLEIYLKDIWPSSEEIAQNLSSTKNPAMYRKIYEDTSSAIFNLWSQIKAPKQVLYAYENASSYIKLPPYFHGLLENNKSSIDFEIRSARALAIFGDSVTTDHISPADNINPDSIAGRYLAEYGIKHAQLNTFGARRGNHEVMIRGTFSNSRIKNLLLKDQEGGFTINTLTSEVTTIYEAAIEYQKKGIPSIVIAGKEYGTGSARDWAAKGTSLLGIKAVIAESFERIHRSNLVGMGVLPCQFKPGTSAKSLELTGKETFDIINIEAALNSGEDLNLLIHRADGATEKVSLICRIDTEIEAEYFKKGGVLPYILSQKIQEKRN